MAGDVLMKVAAPRSTFRVGARDVGVKGIGTGHVRWQKPKSNDSFCMASSKRRGSSTGSKKRTSPKDDLSSKRGDSIGSATELKPASVAGITEDHRFEQFYYNAETTKRIMGFVTMYNKPVFLCNPSLAVAAETQLNKRNDDSSTTGTTSKASENKSSNTISDYLLLDRDDRWKGKLPKNKYKRFELGKPRMVGNSFDYDVVFCDPPFSNVDLEALKTTIQLLAFTETHKKAPLWLAFISDREEDILKVFAEYNLERKPPALGYASVKQETQAKIFLYGPRMG
tara:strand:+ start:11302 stop:12150 length:849 start_codon:yes stop_codon:yes gene_type:complete